VGNRSEYDVVIVGAGIAGCTAATLYGRHGATVALVESHSDPNAYKTVCTHAIQASATPTIERLGIAASIEAAGGVRNGLELWTRYGWIRPRPDERYPYPHFGYSLRREKLDPMLRAIAAETPGVDFMPGLAADEVIGGGRPAGIRATERDGSAREIRAKLVVAADGRDSRVAKLARVRGRVKPHNRFVYFAYYRDLPLVSGTSTQLWFLDPDVRYAFPNDDGITLLAVFQTKEKLSSFKRDLEGNFIRSYEGLPLAPDPNSGERISKMLGKVEMPNVYRPAARPGIAFIGDAALAADPLWGVGCGWAFQSAEWLVDSTAQALVDGSRVDPALERYRKQHRRRLLGHHLAMSDYATGRRFNPMEKLFMSAAARDQRTALRLHAVGSRSAGPGEVMSPRAVGRALWVNATRRAHDRDPEQLPVRPVQQQPKQPIATSS
jgi:menaquinone-9 beta-reductase